MEMYKIIHPDQPDADPAVVSSRAFETIWQPLGYVRLDTPLAAVSEPDADNVVVEVDEEPDEQPSRSRRKASSSDQEE